MNPPPHAPPHAPPRLGRAAAFAAACLVALRATGAPPLAAGSSRLTATLVTVGDHARSAGPTPAAPISAPQPPQPPAPPKLCPRPSLVTPFEGALAVRRAYRSGPQWRFCPHLSTFGAARAGRRSHGGIDISAPTGTPVRAATDGALSFSRDPGGYGYFARLTFAEPTSGAVGSCEPGDEVQVIYGHLVDENPRRSEVARLVHAGDVIGHVGCSGNARGMCSPSPESHLHVTVQRSAGAKRVDPIEYTGWPVSVAAESERPAGWASCR